MSLPLEYQPGGPCAARNKAEQSLTADAGEEMRSTLFEAAKFLHRVSAFPFDADGQAWAGFKTRAGELAGKCSALTAAKPSAAPTAEALEEVARNAEHDIREAVAKAYLTQRGIDELESIVKGRILTALKQVAHHNSGDNQ